MPLDAICLSALTSELSAALVGGRVDKVTMPARDEVQLALRGPAGAVRLLIHIGMNASRLHLTTLPRENPATPPMFCMLLRKHLTGARIASLTQPGLERVVTLTLDTRDEMGHPAEKRLVAELMGRHSNLVLVGPDGRIVDCLRRVDSVMSEKRPVLPGLFYHLPPRPDKADPLSLDTETAWAQALSGLPDETETARWLTDTFMGLSPLWARELTFAATGDPGARAQPEHRPRLAAVCHRHFESVRAGPFTPLLFTKADQPADFSFAPIRQYGNLWASNPLPTFSELLEAFYSERSRREHLRQRAQTLLKTVQSARDRLARKLPQLQTELEQTHRRDDLRICGDLLMAHLHAMGPGMASVTVTDYFSEDQAQRVIALDPRLSPQQNAARYYKKYHKLSRAEEELAGQIVAAEGELIYLESVLDALGRAENEKTLSEIREELAQTRYLRREGVGKRKPQPPAAPLKFVSGDGYTIYVGRSNRQNDRLTLHDASRGDLWFHVQKRPGSHVVVRCEGGEVPERTIGEAALLAVTYSSARTMPRALVDYTRVKFVKKPPGGRPGMVIYSEFSTVMAVPDEDACRALQAP